MSLNRTRAQATRSTDPDTSYEAAKSAKCSTADEAVEEALYALGEAADFQIEEYLKAKGYRFTGQRLRTARKDLENEHIVTYALDHDGVPLYAETATGRRSHMWRLA